jgi:diguanylate cyclase (GGDEF)-like protein/PAS domain S-box-containing protein
MKLLLMNPVVRLSLGLSLFIMTILLGLEMLGVMPDPQQAILDSRKKTCESLAIYGSLAIQNRDFDAIQITMDLLNQRNQDILSAVLRREDGAVLAATGDHASHWDNPRENVSTLQNVKVPLFMGKGDARWGNFEVSFAAMHPNVLHSIWARPMVKILALTIPLAFVGFFLIMKKTLRHLDPSTVVPERVKRTLDSLAEGVILMDREERIVLANKAFEENLGDGHTSFLGRKASELKWQSPQSLQQVKELPWQRAIQDGDSQTAIALCANDSGGGNRTFMVRGAPIINVKGNISGALATFDDVTQIEVQNTKLEKMLKSLEKSREKVRRQNDELQLMATQDSLTECLNRRAFYEQFDVEFKRARQYGHELACIMVDIDRFKSINDNYGHAAADKVLQQVSSILRSSLRDSDVVCRYGGEEFCLLLSETGALDALKTAERIRRVISDKVPFGIQVTLSMGISALEFKAGLPSELLKQSDQALFYAKNSGGDKAAVYSEVPTTLGDDDNGEGLIINTGNPEVDQHMAHPVVEALLLALEHRDMPTAEHCRKVGDLCVAAGQSLMTIDECSVLETAGMLHDIGKLGVPDAILLKPGPLDEKEWLVMKDHQRRSVNMIASTFSSPELVETVKYQSHWFDGSNAENDSQPKGEQIPLGARILLIANAFDAMVSNRPYRSACSYKEAYQELRRCAGTQFDPKLVEHFIAVFNARNDTRSADNSAVSTLLN